MPDTNEIKARPPIMDRSMIQLTTSYAPGVLFTFEGNLVACESKPKEQYSAVELDIYTRDLIFSRIEEIITHWYHLASNCRKETKFLDVVPQMCIDRRLLSRARDTLDSFRRDRFDFVKPNAIAYEPKPLSMICDRCKMFLKFNNLRDFHDKQFKLDRENCCDPKEQKKLCAWRQIDIIFIHPNGNWQPVDPSKHDWDQFSQDTTHKLKACYKCGSYDVRLNDKNSRIGKRYFYCATCGAPRDNGQWIQNDKEMVELFREKVPERLNDVRMRPISYRANSVHYVQGDRIIYFEENPYLELLNVGKINELKHFVSNHFGFESVMPSEEEIEKCVTSTKDGMSEWGNYKNLKNALDSLRGLYKAGNDAVFSSIQLHEQQLCELKNKWAQQGIIIASIKLPQHIDIKIDNRKGYFDNKYDPFRLLIEHQALLETRVNDMNIVDGKNTFVPLDSLDDYLGSEDLEKRKKLNQESSHIIRNLGFSKIGLIRNFGLIHFTFAYSRVSPTPTTVYIGGQIMPVRLNLFPETTVEDRKKHPIFILKQRNEAIYVQLDENHVRNWVESINPREIISPNSVGSQVLENFPNMDMFLDKLPGKGSSDEGPYLSLAIYTLLHTYSHLIMNSIAEFSGLDISSLGEYIFPADLSMVIYRNGSSSDLGNLSSMLRNNSLAFMDYLQDPHSLGCGSGSLCTSRGGACPDCLMIPEMSCIAQNKMLSRSVLIGNGYPHDSGFWQNINGYNDIISNYEI